jgi:hypothetical protein
MGKRRIRVITKDRGSKGFCERSCTPRRITDSTTYDTSKECIKPIGGLLWLMNFWDLLSFEEMFDHVYRRRRRDPEVGHYGMVVGILVLLSIRLDLLWHFVYMSLDAMVCGFFQLVRLLAPSSFSECEDGPGIDQAIRFSR